MSTMNFPKKVQLPGRKKIFKGDSDIFNQAPMTKEQKQDKMKQAVKKLDPKSSV